MKYFLEKLSTIFRLHEVLPKNNYPLYSDHMKNIQYKIIHYIPITRSTSKKIIHNIPITWSTSNIKLSEYVYGYSPGRIYIWLFARLISNPNSKQNSNPNSDANSDPNSDPNSDVIYKWLFARANIYSFSPGRIYIWLFTRANIYICLFARANIYLVIRPDEYI